MQMSESEIKRRYKEAKNQKQQIGILADLNCCSKEEIESILGITKEDNKPPGDMSRGQIMDLLFGKLDSLEQEIQRLEAEYKKVHNAIEVLGTIGSGVGCV